MKLIDETAYCLAELNRIPGVAADRQCSQAFHSKRAIPKKSVLLYLRRMLNYYQQDEDASELLKYPKLAGHLRKAHAQIKAGKSVKWLHSFKPLPLHQVEFVSTYQSSTGDENPFVKTRVKKIYFTKDDRFFVYRATSKGSPDYLFFVYATRSYLSKLAKDPRQRVSYVLYHHPRLKQNFPKEYYQKGIACLKDARNSELYPMGWDFLFNILFTNNTLQQAKFDQPRKYRSGKGVCHQLKASGREAILLVPVPYHVGDKHNPNFYSSAMFNRVLETLPRELITNTKISSKFTKPFKSQYLVSIGFSAGKTEQAQLVSSTVRNRFSPLKEVYVVDPPKKRISEVRTYLDLCIDWQLADRKSRIVRFYTRSDLGAMKRKQDKILTFRRYLPGYEYAVQDRFTAASLPPSFWNAHILEHQMPGKRQKGITHNNLMPSCIFDALIKSNLDKIK